MVLPTPLPRSGPTVIVVPGLGGSGAEHWQTRWQRARSDTVRAELGDRNTPDRDTWVGRLDETIRGSPAPVVLAAHSLGCLAVAWWAASTPVGADRTVVGTLLVAPPDVEAATAPAEVGSFAPAPRGVLPFSSILVCSDDDPWIAPPVAQSLAATWGSEYVQVTGGGHLNAESALGDWPDGQRLLATDVNRRGGRPMSVPLGPGS